MSLLIDQQKCIGCGMCTKDCLRGCLEVQNGHAVAVNNRLGFFCFSGSSPPLPCESGCAVGH